MSLAGWTQPGQGPDTYPVTWSPPAQAIQARARRAVSLLLLWGLGYFLIGHSELMRNARDVSTPLDAAIPFVGWTVWIYLSGLAFIIAPVFVLRHVDAFQHAARSYALTLLGSFACFLAMPVSAVHLRDSAGAANFTGLVAWVADMLYGVDPPYNLFPSLHVSLSALAWWSMTAAYPGRRRALAIMACLIMGSVLTTRQHLVIDVAGGLALAWTAHAITGRRRGNPPVVSAALCLALVTSLFGLLYWHVV